MKQSTTDEFHGENRCHKKNGKDEATSNLIYAWTCVRFCGSTGNRWPVEFAIDLVVERYLLESVWPAKIGPVYSICAHHPVWMASTRCAPTILSSQQWKGQTLKDCGAIGTERQVNRPHPALASHICQDNRQKRTVRCLQLHDHFTRHTKVLTVLPKGKRCGRLQRFIWRKRNPRGWMSGRTGVKPHSLRTERPLYHLRAQPFAIQDGQSSNLDLSTLHPWNRDHFTVALSLRVVFGDSPTTCFTVGRQVLAKLFVNQELCAGTAHKTFGKSGEPAPKRTFAATLAGRVGQSGALSLAALGWTAMAATLCG
eukprot:3027054-Amphidinium_carterae.2